jgi:flagellar biosynthetic protein FlhB
MADTPEADEKTEAPTEKRRKDAAKEGDILKSRDLSTAAVMMLGAGYLALMGPAFVNAMADVLRRGLSISRSSAVDFAPMDTVMALLAIVAMPVIGLFAVTILGAIGGQAALGSLTFNAKMFEPKFSRMNPLAGLKRMFGMQGLIELGKSIVKVTVVGAVGYWVLAAYSTEIAALGSEDVAGAVGHVGKLTSVLLLTLAFALVVVAGADVPLQMFQLMRKLRMSKKELKDEYKETEGSPEVKGQLRRRAREILKNNARAGVAQADVILTNPTHFSVALRYDRAKDKAPVVVAKGKGEAALAIRELAAERKLPVLEYPLLARAVYFTSKVGQEIRDDLYVAVASVLAFVFHVDREALQRPEVEVPAEARFDEHGKPLN